MHRTSDSRRGSQRERAGGEPRGLLQAPLCQAQPGVPADAGGRALLLVWQAHRRAECPPALRRVLPKPVCLRPRSPHPSITAHRRGAPRCTGRCGYSRLGCPQGGADQEGCRRVVLQDGRRHGHQPGADPAASRARSTTSGQRCLLPARSRCGYIQPETACCEELARPWSDSGKAGHEPLLPRHLEYHRHGDSGTDPCRLERRD